jgi:hypothetical protein
MIRIASEEQLLAKFRPIDRDEVQIPSNFKFPLAIKDYLTWVEPSGHRVYLVFEDVSSGKPLGVVFQRTRGAGETPAAMCQWCHTVRPGPAVGLLTAAADRDHRIGIHLCSNLNCRENALAPPNVHDLRESLGKYEKLHRILSRMSDFSHRNLF